MTFRELVLAFIGRNPSDEDNVYIVTGDSVNGMTHGTIAGMLLADLIMGRKTPWEELYDPGRKSLKSSSTYVEENASFAGQIVTKWVKPGEVGTIDEIAAGEGAIMRKGVDKIAAYKDADGEVHTFFAVCTHLGCIVQWNSGEKSWDCPCHSSRFDTDGKILDGLAIQPLKKEGIDAVLPLNKQGPSKEIRA